MFSDLVGYTARSINSKREEQRQLVIAHERIVEPQVLALSLIHISEPTRPY